MDKTFLIFGDSITYGAPDNKSGWAGRLKELVERKNLESEDLFYIVYNLGVGGDNTEDLLKRFDSETGARFDDTEDTAIIFAIGVNDSQFVHSLERNRIILGNFKKNIKALIKAARKYTSKIIFVGLIPVDETRTMPVPWNKDKSYKNEYIQKYDEAIEIICKKNSIFFIEIFENLKNQNYQNLLTDGLHPNSDGYDKIFEIIKDFLVNKKII